MDDVKELQKVLKSILASQNFAVLCSESDGQPYGNLVAFAVTEDLKSLIFVTNRKTRKYRNIIENHQVSLLIDSRTNRFTDITKATAITVIGSANETEDKKGGFLSSFQFHNQNQPSP